MNALVLLITTIFLFTFVVTSFFRPKYGLFLLLLTRPIIDHIDLLRINSVPGVGVNYLQFIGFVIPFTLLAILFLKKVDGGYRAKISFYDHALANYYFLYILACIPAVFLASEIFLMFGDWLRLFTLWVILVYAVNVLKSKEDLSQALFIIVLGSLYPLAQFFIDFITHDFVFRNGRLRNLGGYLHQGMASRILLTFIPAYLVAMTMDGISRIKRICYIFLFFFLLISIYYTYFRTIMLALSALLTSYIFFRKYFKLLATAMFGVIAVVITSSYVWKDIVQESFAVLININHMFSPFPSAYDDLLSGRFGIWRVLLSNYIHHANITNIFFGFGYKLPTRSLDVNIAHNQLIQMMNRFGTLPAIIFYLFLYKTITYSLKRNVGLIPNAITAYILALFCATFAGGLFNDVRTLWYFGPYLAILIKYHSIDDALPSSYKLR